MFLSCSSFLLYIPIRIPSSSRYFSIFYRIFLQKSVNQFSFDTGCPIGPAETAGPTNINLKDKQFYDIPSSDVNVVSEIIDRHEADVANTDTTSVHKLEGV